MPLRHSVAFMSEDWQQIQMDSLSGALQLVLQHVQAGEKLVFLAPTLVCKNKR